MKRILILLLIMAMIASLSISAAATQTDSISEGLSLTIVYSQSDDVKVKGAPLKLYKIASVDDNFKITMEEDFSNFAEEIKDKDIKWDLFAESLATHISVNEIDCDDETVTDESGVGSFPTQDHKLTPGVYLILSPRYRFDGNIFVPAPVLLTLPNIDYSGAKIEDVTAKMKFTTTPDKPFDIIVEKKWNDPGYEKKRAKEVTVQLIKDGQIQTDMTLILSEKNNWSGQWTNLDPIHKWSVNEVKVPNYTVTYRSDEKDGKIYFMILNTYLPNPSDKLPQTGQLTWPIAWMAVAGMTLLIFGWQLCKSSRKDSDEA